MSPSAGWVTDYYGFLLASPVGDLSGRRGEQQRIVTSGLSTPGPACRPRPPVHHKTPMPSPLHLAGTGRRDTAERDGFRGSRHSGEADTAIESQPPAEPLGTSIFSPLSYFPLVSASLCVYTSDFYMSPNLHCSCFYCSFCDPIKFLPEQ